MSKTLQTGTRTWMRKAMKRDLEKRSPAVRAYMELTDSLDLLDTVCQSLAYGVETKMVLPTTYRTAVRKQLRQARRLLRGMKFVRVTKEKETK